MEKLIDKAVEVFDTRERMLKEIEKMEQKLEEYSESFDVEVIGVGEDYIQVYSLSDIKKIAEEMGTKVKIEDRQYTVGFPLEACTYVKGIKFLAVYRGDDENDDTRTER